VWAASSLVGRWFGGWSGPAPLGHAARVRLLLIRHGESMGNVDPAIHRHTADHAIPLSPRGREQARAAGDHIARFFEARHGEARPHVRLWTSPYRRTRETADGIAEVARDWITDRREHVLLCEQQFGLFDGIPDEELPSLFPHEWAHYRKQERFEGRFWARYPLGESRFDVATRVYQAFGSFQRDLEQGVRDHVVVCHGVTLRAFLMMWCHLTPEWFEAEPNPHNCAIRLLEEGRDHGYLFEGFPKE
jgi:2,3-bisphosphoglycerate-dependent phosphoglycerate mutase